MPLDEKRVRKELTECEADRDDSGVVAWIVEGNISHWKGKIKGPADTVYQGGVFLIDVKLTDSYPFEPPKMTFDTKVWHPNVSSQTGAICLDILKKEWRYHRELCDLILRSPALTIKTALLSIQALLASPEPSDPQDAVVAEMFKTDRAKFDQQARNWTEFFAVEASGSAAAIASLTEMGFNEEQAKAALTSAGGNVEQALELLFSGAAASPS